MIEQSESNSKTKEISGSLLQAKDTTILEDTLDDAEELDQDENNEDDEPKVRGDGRT
jgi:hypothetical protein